MYEAAAHPARAAFFCFSPYEPFELARKTKPERLLIHPMDASIMMMVIVAKVDRTAFLRVILFPGPVELSCCSEGIRPLDNALPDWRSNIREIVSFTLSGSVFFS
ncbi:hypothetical protein FZ983_32430 [Azospirillum sp. B21]|uniref:hypothetical protein n=1 Tax=Azospirillum sp. B21 TaxID=2607496 RepID=UPI0011EF5359|nr:hypothetical protein [Azospirillum sp. B21]KAA0572096.1 hypothetical protein FZ983_32430 [Azospirillum sp. B21]